MPVVALKALFNLAVSVTAAASVMGVEPPLVALFTL